MENASLSINALSRVTQPSLSLSETRGSSREPIESQPYPVIYAVADSGRRGLLDRKKIDMKRGECPNRDDDTRRGDRCRNNSQLVITLIFLRRFSVFSFCAVCGGGFLTPGWGGAGQLAEVGGASLPVVLVANKVRRTASRKLI